MRPNFENTAIAFELKSDSQLERAYFLFKLISNEPLVRIGTAVTNFAIKAHLPVEGLIRATVFDHFCGGVNEEDCLPIIDNMYGNGVCSILDYSAEGKEVDNQFDFAMEKTLDILDFVKEKDAMPFAVFKPTGFGRFKLFEKISTQSELNEDEKAEWGRIVNRFEKVCQKAHKLDVALLIDAEESWMQDAADDLVLDMMRKYNKEKTIVFNTFQMYRWDRMDYIKKLYGLASDEGFKIGAKVVRGAYMEKENDRANDKGYESPICKSKQETDENFDASITYMMEHLNQFTIFAGTHNEQSTLKLIDLMEKQGVPTNDERIWFGQLFGMSDHITYNLAAHGYNAVKYVPYGPVRDVMPYLIRRAEENTSVAGQTSRELALITKERKRRRLGD
ncbi:proline dehydrogenase family protein [Flagellimonas halotolerans]|uniref:Proline dehydrogenase family protein n=1 Tax=Flagellimonas halotolerans TaxID=3112164 RepID=A0ABU6IN15_9FLAO|nr:MULTISPECIES: proline dehydrogenase family protein [unclassified Allomuricauda]MEC3964640.1 proline dehydrogenase family protein [Muricauda sp. SYSU M86414]MEC4264509.1 proline dehydrogenase family protein [Muricauda sp. SYSU M84420]